jgi:cytochrome c oxidase subunit 2
MSWVLFAGAAAIFAGVMALALYAVFARRENASRLSPRTLVVGGGIAFTTVTLFALLLYSLARASTLHPAEDNALRIEVIGEQWWWRVRYPDFETANEIRVPIGRPVELVLRSADVVHSFWVPVLAGKLDMIPGRANVLRVRADRPGRVRGSAPSTAAARTPSWRWSSSSRSRRHSTAGRSASARLPPPATGFSRRTARPATRCAARPPPGSSAPT